jgi:hypothetical protein
MFDLGPHKDIENPAPPIAHAAKAGVGAMPVDRDLVEQLVDDEVDLGSISAIVWRLVSH